MDAALSSGDVDAMRLLLSGVKNDQMDAPAEEVAAAARKQAAIQRTRADELSQQAQEMLQEAKNAESAARMAQAEAETKSRAAHYVSAKTDAYPIGSGDGDFVLVLCAKLATTKEEVRNLECIKRGRQALGVDGARGLAFLMAAGTMQRLEVLSLACNALGELGTAALADAFNPASPLQQLDLSSNSVGEVGTAALTCALERGALPLLAKLSLRNNDISDEGAAGLARVAHDQLEWLNLSDNRVAEEGTSAIAAALLKGRFPRLRRLSLSNNQLGDHAMNALASALDLSTPLEELYVDCNPAGEAATRRVEKHFDEAGEDAPPPWCVIC